jgi:hypothetical protein
MPAPSDAQKPSRSTSNGRDKPVGESARMLAKPARLVGVRQASAPPATATSLRPLATQRAAFATAWVPVAQEVATVSHGPSSDHRIDTAAEAAFGITMGTVSGETDRSPLFWRISACCSQESAPPIPLPISTPTRSGSTPASGPADGSSRRPASASAWAQAAKANCANRSKRRASTRARPAASGSKSSTRRTTLAPTGVDRPAQNASAPVPHGATTPTPVTTTRRPSRDSIIRLSSGVPRCLTRGVPYPGPWG